MKFFSKSFSLRAFSLVLACIFGPSIFVKGQAVSLPYFNDFEGSAAPFTDSLVFGSPWQLGIPNFGLTTGSHSGINAWDIELNAPYQNSSLSYLTSPFFNTGGTSAVMLSFWQNRNTESSWDGVRVEYTTDSVNWFILGFAQDPNATNWYTTNSINSSGLPAWDGTSNGWIQSTYNLSGLGITTSFKIRFVFSSDISVPADGFTIDDFGIYLLPSKDAGVSAVPNFLFLTAGTNTSTFNITVKNFGSQAFNAFSVSYRINNGTPVTVPSTFNLQPGNVVNISVPGFVVPSGTYNFCAYTTLLADTNPVNDTLCLQAIGLSAAVLPYFNNFDSGSADWSPVMDASGTDWELGTPNYGSTSTTHSGTNCWDVNLNAGYTQNAITYLYSPVFDFTGIYNSVLSFYRNQKCGLYAGANLKYSTDAGATWNLLGVYQDPTAMNWFNGFLGGSNWEAGWTDDNFGWMPCSIPLTVLNNTDSVIFCFVFASDTSSGDGVSIDDLNISVPPAVDAGITFIQVQSLNATGSLTPGLDVVLLNYASQPLDSVTVTYTVNGGPPVSGTYLVSLAPGLGAYVTLAGYVVPNGTYSICAYTDLLLDGNHSNDTLCISLTGLPVVNLPYSDNFDAGNSGWGTRSDMNPADQWQLGIPVTGIPNAAFSAPSCWDLNLNTTYIGPSACYLYTPVFNFTNAVKPVLSFKQNCNTENFWDGVRMEYSINGSSWLLLGYYADPNGINWYTTQILNSSGFPGWSGNSGGWISSGYDLDILGIPNGSQVGFRYVFNADNVGIYDGMAIDDFSIEVLLAQDAMLDALVSPGNGASSGASTPVQVLLKNNGLIPLTALDISYVANGTLIGPFSWTGYLITDSTEVVTLPPFVPVVGNNDLSVFLEWPADLNHSNDTLKKSLTGLLSVSIPYSDDFENGSLGWDVYASPFANTTWELGYPSFGVTSGTHSGDTCWDINLASECGNLANTILFTPIFNFSNGSNSRLSCWINFDTEPFADGFYIEYSTNGNTWQTLGVPNDSKGTNWYNGVITNNQPAWSISSQGWKNATYNTSFLDGVPYVRMRFKFTSDFAISSVGASLDDFSIMNFTGVQEKENRGFKLYPTPANDFVFVEIPGNMENPVGIRITDLPGKVVYVTTEPNKKTGKIKLDISLLKPGAYFIIIETKDKAHQCIFIKG